ncbi:MAG: ATP-binding protein [Ardenticatenaceae bacterium]|nr:ATP-binding protein [Ardenticatenaceae bacterium]
MSELEDFGNYFNSLVETNPLGNSKLADLVNHHPDFTRRIHRNTIQNWRNGQKPTDPIQFLYVLYFLYCDIEVVEQLLHLAELPSLDEIFQTAKEEEYTVLKKWMSSLPFQDIQNSVHKIKSQLPHKAETTLYQLPPLNYRREVADILSFYSEIFVGREDEIQRISALAGSQEPGYLLIEAPPGFGKTALVTNLINRYETALWPQSIRPTLLYFFIRQFGNQNTRTAYLKSINSQLLTVLDKEGGISNDDSTLHIQFNVLWKEAVEHASATKPLLLLLDGFDEMASEPESDSVATELPVVLAPYVHIVITSRETPKALPQVSLTHPFRQADVWQLKGITESDIVNLLHVYGVDAEEAHSLAPHISESVGGEPLLARFVSQEVAESEDRQAKLASIKNDLPKDVLAYFDGQLKYLQSRANIQLSQDVLGLLLITKGKIASVEIAGVLKKRTWDVEQAIKPIQRFLIGQEHYELMHLELRRAVAKRFSQSELKSFERKIMNWGYQFQSDGWQENTPRYLLLHYAAHLYDNHEFERLYQLLDRNYMRAKLTVNGSYSAFGQDVMLVINASKKVEPLQWVPFLHGCAVYATLRASVSRLPIKVFLALALLGQIDRALSYIALISSVRRRCEAFLELIRGVHETDLHRLPEIIDQALDATKNVPNETELRELLSQIAGTLVQIGRPNKALEVANNLTDGWYKENLFSQIVNNLSGSLHSEQLLSIFKDITNWETELETGIVIKTTRSLTQAGYSDQILNVVSDIIDEESRVWILIQVAEGLTQAGEINQAIDILYRVLAMTNDRENGWQKTKILAAICRVLTQAGSFDQALQTITSIADVREKTKLLIQIARGLTQTDEQIRATEVLNQVLTLVNEMVGMDSWHRAKSLIEICEIFAQIGYYDKALQVATIITDKRHKVNGLVKVAKGLIEAGKQTRATEVLSQALAVTNDEESDWQKTEILVEICEILAQTGSFDQALQVAKNITDEWGKVKGLIEITKGLPQADGQSIAADILAQALAAACSILNDEKEDKEKKIVLSQVANVLVQAGYFDQALHLLNGVFNDGYKVKILTQVAKILAKTGYSDRLLHLVSEIDLIDEKSKMKIFIQIAKGLASACEQTKTADILDRVLSMTNDREDDWQKSEILAEICELQAQVGYYDRALEVASDITNNWQKTKSLIQVALMLTRAGKRSEALDALEQALHRVEKTHIVGNDDKAEVLIQIATGLTNAGNKFEATEVLKQALSITNDIDDQWHPKEYLLSEISKKLAQAGSFDKAFQIANNISDEPEYLLNQIAELLMQDGSVDQALSVIKVVVDWHQPKILGKIAKGLIEAGKLEQENNALNKLLNTLNDIADGWSKAYELTQIAKALVLAGEQSRATEVLDQALSATNDISDDEYKKERIVEISETLVQASSFDKAIYAINGVADNRSKAEIFTQIAKGLIQVGEQTRAMEVIDSALVLADKTADYWSMGTLLERISESFALAGKQTRARQVFDQALFAINKTDNIMLRTSRFVHLALRLAQAGEKARATEVLEQALLVANNVSFGKNVANALGQIAEGLTLAEFLSHELHVAYDIWNEVSFSIEIATMMDQIDSLLDHSDFSGQESYEANDIQTKDIVFSKIARVLAKAKSFDQALQVIGNIVDSKDKVELLIQVSKGLTEAGKQTRATEVLEHALSSANDIGDSNDKVEVFIHVAKAFVRAGSFPQGLAVINNIPDGENKVEVLIQAAKGLFEIGMETRATKVLDQALSLTHNIPDKKLGQIARILTKAGFFNHALFVITSISDEEVIKSEELSQFTFDICQLDEQILIESQLCDVIEVACHEDLNTFWSVLASAAPYLTNIDNGYTLYKVYEVLEEVQSWW